MSVALSSETAGPSPYEVELLERSLLQILVDNESHCWVWQGRKSRNGYGRISVRGRERAAHRVIWSLMKGEEIEDDMVLDHLCRNRPCCNPDHLEKVTHQVNTARGEAVLFCASVQTGPNP